MRDTRKSIDEGGFDNAGAEVPYHSLDVEI
jgi:hypothetical protein